MEARPIIAVMAEDIKNNWVHLLPGTPTLSVNRSYVLALDLPDADILLLAIL